MKLSNTLKLLLPKLVPFLLVTLIAGCYSGENRQTGRVVKGVISNGLVSAYLAHNNTLISQVRSNESGYFSLDLTSVSDDDLVLLRLSVDSNTRMRCDVVEGCFEKTSGQVIAFGENLRLPSYFQLLGTTTKTAVSPPQLTPLSHLIVKTAQSLPDGLSKQNLDTAADWLMDDFNLSFNPLTTPAIDLTTDENASSETLKQGILSAAFYDQTVNSDWSDVNLGSPKLLMKEVLIAASDLASQYSNYLDTRDQNSHAYTSMLHDIANDNLDLAHNIQDPSLEIQSQPQAVTTNEGTSFSLSVLATGDSELNFQWQKDGQDILGATASIYYVQNAELNDAGIYSVTVSDNNNSIRSLETSVSIEKPLSAPITSEPGPSDQEPTPAAPALVIESQPNPASALESQSFSLSVSVSGGSASYTYQWRKDGVNLTGKRSSTLYVSNASLNDSGLYSVIISSGDQTIESQAARVSIEALKFEPFITEQPNATSVYEGAKIELSVSASGSGPLSYQWQKNGINLFGENNSTLTRSSSEPSDTGSYRVLVSNDVSQVYSNIAIVQVIQYVGPTDTLPEPTPETDIPELVIQNHPESSSLLESETFSLSVLASGGTSNYTYQWKKDNTDIVGAYANTYTVSNAQLENAGIYSVVVTSGDKHVRSLDALVEISQPTLPVVITQQPSAVSVNEGEEILLSVSANGGEPLSYQWQKGGSVIPNANQSTLVITNSSLNDSGSYRVLVSNDVSQEYSDFANVLVNEQIDPPAILSQPRSSTAIEQTEVTFSINASGDGFLAYQWRKDGIAINGAYNNSLTIESVNSDDAGNYDVIVSNSQGSVTSSIATLEVVSSTVSVTITLGPQAQELTSGENLVLTVQATGDGPLAYQWKHNGEDISGANAQSLTITNATTNATGMYSVVVSNSSSSDQSDAVFVSINPALMSVDLSWTAPDRREDGSYLSTNDIAGYLVEYGYSPYNFANSVRVSSSTNHTINDLSSGTLYVRIATIDDQEIRGQFSETIEISIP